MSLEGIQHIDSNYWDEGHDNSGPPCSPSMIGGDRHGRTQDLLAIVALPHLECFLATQRARVGQLELASIKWLCPSCQCCLQI